MHRLLSSSKGLRPLAAMKATTSGLYTTAKGHGKGSRQRRRQLTRVVLLRSAGHGQGLEQRVTAQVLRRTFNTLMVLGGVDRIVLRSQMGHSSEEMTRRYAGVSAADKQEAVRMLESMTSEG